MDKMKEQSDAQLLRDYAERGNEVGFTELVTRHTDLVYRPPWIGDDRLLVVRNRRDHESSLESISGR